VYVRPLHRHDVADPLAGVEQQVDAKPHPIVLGRERRVEDLLRPGRMLADRQLGNIAARLILDVPALPRPPEQGGDGPQERVGGAWLVGARPSIRRTTSRRSRRPAGAVGSILHR
jgi:hypothetical protein